MHIIAIAWLYVVVMIAVVSDTLWIGVLHFTLLGALPLAVVLALGRLRRQRRGGNEPPPGAPD